MKDDARTKHMLVQPLPVSYDRGKPRAVLTLRIPGEVARESGVISPAIPI